METENQELNRTIALLSDPREKFQVMLNNHMGNEALQLIKELLMSDSLVYFQDKSHAQGYCGPKDKGELRLQFGQELCIDPIAFRKIFDWDELTFNTLVSEIFEKLTSKPPRLMLYKPIGAFDKKRRDCCISSFQLNATEKAMFMLLPKGHPLWRQTEGWIMLGTMVLENNFTNGYFMPAGLEKLVDKAALKSPYCGDDPWEKLPKKLKFQDELTKLVITYFHDLGFSDDVIREEFLAAIGGRYWVLPIYTIGMLRSSVIRSQDYPRVSKILKKSILRAMEDLVSGRDCYHPLVIGLLCQVGFLEGKDNLKLAQQAFRTMLAMKLAEGEFGRINSLVSLVASKLFGTHTEVRNFHEVWVPNFNPSDVAAQAFQIAWQAKKYGICAALVRQFGEETCLDKELLRTEARRLVKQEANGQKSNEKLAELFTERQAQIREAFNLATIMNQPIQLNYTPAFMPRI